jgi:NAD(P)H-quinone oxidoreductase subunit 5
MSEWLSGAKFLELVIVAMPILLVLALGMAALSGRPLSEELSGQLIQSVNVIGLAAALLLLVSILLSGGAPHRELDLGNWVHVGDFHFRLKLIFDRLSIPFVILTYALCGTVGAFAVKYLHREPGYHRFFMLYAFFVMGMILASAAGTIETLFAGWEFVGLSSAFLVAFFHDRPSPVRNGFLVWSTYRVADAALLLGAVVLHHLSGGGDFDQLLSVHSWPNGRIDEAISAGQITLIGFLFLIAAAGKSGLIPFSGWLPRAMEGPTPSSAVFYGALSIHLGIFLLLRFSPLLDSSPFLQGCVIAVGLSTALFAALTGRVQTDIKCALTYASLTQVGLIVAEIGLGWDYIPLVHTIGHACLRTLQFLRAPSLLHDSHVLENAVGRHLTGGHVAWLAPLPLRWRTALYRYGLERGSWDAWLQRLVVNPFMLLFRTCDRWEQRWASWLNGLPPQPSHPAPHQAESLAELP